MVRAAGPQHATRRQLRSKNALARLRRHVYASKVELQPPTRRAVRLSRGQAEHRLGPELVQVPGWRPRAWCAVVVIEGAIANRWRPATRREHLGQAVELSVVAHTGCDLHPACLTCPFEHCRYDKQTTRPQNIGLVAFEKYRVDNQQALQLRHEGMTIQGISEQLNVSKRTVLRWFAAQRNQAGKAA